MCFLRSTEREESCALPTILTSWHDATPRERRRVVKAEMVARARTFTAEPSSWDEVLPLTDLPPTVDNAVSRLRALSLFADNWDGSGSPHITKAAKQSAVALLLVMRPYAEMPAMQLDPVSGGGLQFSWEIGPRALEVEILPNGAVECLAADGDDMIEGPLNGPPALIGLLRWLLRS
jgi:hypothetical protein